MTIYRDADEGEPTGGGEVTAGDLKSDFDSIAAEGGTETPAGDGTPETPVSTPGETPEVSETPATPATDWQSRAEAAERRHEELSQFYRDQTEQTRALMSQLRPQPVQQQPSRSNFDLAKFQELSRTDPMAAIQMAGLYGMQSNPEMMKELLAPHLQPFNEQQQRYQEHLHAERTKAYHAELANKYPAFKQDSPEYRTTYDYVMKNDWCAKLAQNMPGVNAVEVAYKVSNYDQVAQKLLAAEAKLVDKRSKAATVKVGTGVGATPKAGSAARTAAADMADKGMNIPESWQNAMESALERKMAF